MKYTLENCTLESLKYHKKSDFRNFAKGYYQASLRNKWLDDICSHMIKQNKWTFEKLYNEALKYSSRSSFQKNSRGAYSIAYERAILDDICSHMVKLDNTKWTKEKCHEKALKFNTRKSYGLNCSSYQVACRNNWIDDICSHMRIPTRGWARETYLNRKTILYYIKVDNLYKIGLKIFDGRYKNTENNILQGRYREDIKNGIKIKILQTTIFDNGVFAFDKEKEILRTYDIYKYKYISENKNNFSGYTELFYKDIGVII